MKKSQIFSFCTIAFAALGTILYLVATAIKWDFGILGSSNKSGINVIFGGNGMDFSFLLFLGFIFAIAGIVITVLPLAGVKAKFFPFVALGLFIAAAILVFLTLKVCVVAGDMGVDGTGAGLGVGAILGGIFYICAAATSALPLVIKD